MRTPRFNFARGIGDDQRGITVVEFAIIIGPLCIVIMALGDLGYQSYLRAVAQGVLDRASRSASVGGMTAVQTKDFIAQQMQTIAPNNSPTPTVTMQSYYNFSRIGKPEKITVDTTPLGAYNAGDCYEDANGNGKYDRDRGNTGLGGADDTVSYKVELAFPRLFPMANLLGWSRDQSVTVSTIIRNQPWANQSAEFVKEICV